MVDSLALTRHSALLLRWRSLIIGCFAIAAATYLASTALSRRGTEVLVAALELTHGTVIAADDVTRARVVLPPAGADVLIADPTFVIGRRVIGHIAPGEPITTTRVQVHPTPTDMTAMAVPISDADAALVSIGDQIDIYARQSDMQGRSALRIATMVEVVKVTLDTSRFARANATATVLVDSTSAAAIAAASDQERLSIAVHGINTGRS